MRTRTAILGDLETVFEDLAKRMADDYLAAGKGTKAAFDNLMMNLAEGRAHALLNGDDVIAVIAWNEDDETAHTLFAAREDFFSAGSVRFCRRHIRQLQALAGNLPIHSRSWDDRPEIVRWFKLLGYEERGREDGAKLFVLPPA